MARLPKLTGTGVRHAEQERALVLKLEVLVLELVTVNAFAARAVASSKVAALDHELLDDSVESATLVVQRLAVLAQALLARAQGAEVLGRLGDDIVVQLEGDAALGLIADGHVEEDVAALLGLCRGCHFRSVRAKYAL